MVNYDKIVIQAGEPGRLDTYHAYKTIAATRLAMKRYPDAQVEWWVPGYDDDPRELWDVPEVARHIRLCAEGMGFTDAYDLPLSRLTGNMLALLVKCGTFGEDHPFEIIP